MKLTEEVKAKALQLLDKFQQDGQSSLENYTIEEIEAMDTYDIINKLQVLQTELELQNNELMEQNHKLEISKQAISSIFNNSPFFMAILDKRGTIVEINRAGLQKVNEIAFSDVIGKSFYRFLKPAFRGNFLSTINKINDDTTQGIDNHPYFIDVKIQKNKTSQQLVLAPLQKETIFVIMHNKQSDDGFEEHIIDNWINRRVTELQLRMTSDILLQFDPQDSEHRDVSSSLLRSKELSEQLLSYLERDKSRKLEVPFNTILADFRDSIEINDFNISNWNLPEDNNFSCQVNPFIINHVLLMLLDAFKYFDETEIETRVEVQKLPENYKNIDTRKSEFLIFRISILRQKGNLEPIEDNLKTYDLDMAKYIMEINDGFLFLESSENNDRFSFELIFKLL